MSSSPVGANDGMDDGSDETVGDIVVGIDGEGATVGDFVGEMEGKPVVGAPVEGGRDGLEVGASVPGTTVVSLNGPSGDTVVSLMARVGAGVAEVVFVVLLIVATGVGALVTPSVGAVVVVFRSGSDPSISKSS